MIALKLLFQSLAGVGSIGALCSAGYFYSQDSESTKYTYVIVSAQTPITGNTAETSALFTNDNKNYECKFGEIIDKSCEIYKLSSSNATKKTIDLNFFNSEHSKLKTAHTFAINENFILKLEASKFKAKESTTTTITLRNKSEGQEQKVFSNFDIKYSFEPNYKDIKSNVAVVRALNIATSTNPTITSTTKFSCTVGDSESFPCELKKTSAEINISTFDSANWTTLTPPSANADIKEDHFYIVDFLNKPQTRRLLKKENVTISLFETSKPETKFGDFKFEQLLIGKTTPTTDLYEVKENHESFLVASLATAETDQATTDPITTSTKKNYSCKFSPTSGSILLNGSCELYKLTFDETKKSLNFPWDSSKESLVTTKSELTANSLFKLRIDADAFKDVDFSLPQTITLQSTASADINKTYATLTTKAWFKNEQLVGKTSLILGKPSATPTETTYECKVGSTKAACEIYKFTTAQTTTPATKSSLIFTEPTIVTTASDIKSSDFYILDLKTQLIDVNSTIANIEVVKTDGTAILNFSNETTLIANITGTNKKAIIIK